MTTIRKSFKREIAVAGLIYWAFLTTFMFLWMDESRIKALETPFEAVTWSTWVYTAAAFGLHALATQWGASK